jgi:hypothetical protein
MCSRRRLLQIADCFVWEAWDVWKDLEGEGELPEVGGVTRGRGSGEPEFESWTGAPCVHLAIMKIIIQ